VTPSQAYRHFEELLATCPPESDLAALLSNPATDHKNKLLAAMADRETALTSPTLLSVIRTFLTDPTPFTRRVAALALFSGGPDAVAVLQEEMEGRIPKDFALDFIELFRLASGVTS
jgi:hypothetical protein